FDDTSDDFAVSNHPSLPITLSPESSTEIVVTFEPTFDGGASGDLIVTSNEPLGERYTELTGEGVYAGEYVDQWDHPVDPPTDILFSVDLSGSMSDDVANLAANFSTFIGELSNYTSDWQVMVANDDDGCRNGDILRPSTPNYPGRFSSAIQDCANCFGEPWNTERLLSIVSAAVGKTDPGQCNQSFMREGAMLHIIMVSDEPEQSAQHWSNYVNSVTRKKGDAELVRMSAIAGPMPNGCETAKAGEGYAEAVDATGGVFLNICSNWASGDNLELLAEASVIPDRYPLGQDALEQTIEVRVNGSVVPDSSWDFDAASNAVIFTSAPPEEGDEIEISYASPGDCG
ncbi:MAG: hypothetical protein AAFV53_41470, partial [Myxococcota bacterium]